MHVTHASSLAAQTIDRRYFGASLAQLDFLQLPVLGELSGELSGAEWTDERALLPWIGVDPPYLLASLSLIGLSGFLTLVLVLRAMVTTAPMA